METYQNILLVLAGYVAVNVWILWRAKRRYQAKKRRGKE